MKAWNKAKHLRVSGRALQRDVKALKKARSKAGRRNPSVYRKTGAWALV